MKTHLEAAVLERAELEPHSFKTREERTAAQDERISVVVSDASYMNSELLARALSRTKGLNVLRCTAHLNETLEAIVRLAPDVNVLSVHFSDGPYKGLELL